MIKYSQYLTIIAKINQILTYVLKSSKIRALGVFMKIAIATDSNSGLHPNEVEGTNIFLLPMPFLIDGEEYFENINLTANEFFQKQIAGADIHTSQPNIFALTNFWTDILNEYDAVIYIPMSSALSASTETAKNLGSEPDFQGKVFVVDNQRISLSQKQSVFDAQKLAEEGKNPQEIVKYLEDTKTENSIYIMVPDLKYLKRGGRITKTAAMIGTLLKIKPILQIQGGKLDSFAKALTLKKAKETMIAAVKKDIETRFSEQFKNNKLNISVAYTFDKALGEEFKQEIQSALPNVNITWVNPLSLSISCHIGPNAVAVAISSIY